MADAPTQPAEPLDRAADAATELAAATRSVYQAIWNTDYDTDLEVNGRSAAHTLAEQITGALAAAGLLAAPAAQPAINVTVDREANAAYVKVADGVVFRTAEINNSVNADYDRSAQLLGVEILDLPLAPAAPAARLPKGAASQIATTVHNALCGCMGSNTGITLRSRDWDLVRDAVAALLESWQGASPAAPADDEAVQRLERKFDTLRAIAQGVSSSADDMRKVIDNLTPALAALREGQ